MAINYFNCFFKYKEKCSEAEPCGTLPTRGDESDTAVFSVCK